MRKSLIACLGLLLLLIPYIPVASANNEQGSSTNVGMPVSANFYINGFPDTGIFDFKVVPSSSLSLNVTAEYPWAEFPSAGSFKIQYAFAPFPLSGTVPTWLGLSISPSSSSMAPGSSSSATLRIAVSNVGIGSRGSFALHALYVDPVSGVQIMHVMVINITLTSNPAFQSTPIPVDVPGAPNVGGGSGSWALGTGLCDLSTTSDCRGVGISWGSVVGEALWFTIPSNFYDSLVTGIVLTGAFASGWYFQFTLQAPTSQGGSWQETAWVLKGNTVVCQFNSGTPSSGSSWVLQILYNSAQGIWYFADPTYNWQLQFFCSGYPSSSSFYSENQEPFAFESLDTNAAHFIGFFLNTNPVFQYATSPTSWYNPPGAWVVNAYNYPAWPGYVVGNNGVTPAQFQEAGHLQCSSLGTYQLEQALKVCSNSGTNTFKTRLM